MNEEKDKKKHLYSLLRIKKKIRSVNYLLSRTEKISGL